MRWRQGEHVSILGHTGSGKTTLALRLLDQRRYVVALANKTKDDTLGPLVRRGGGWTKITSWPPSIPPRFAPKVVVWPRPRSLAEAKAVQADTFYDVLDGVYLGGGWTIFVDEAYYVSNTLGLADYLKLLWQQGRSAGTSMVTCSQRPAFVPLEMYSEATHLFAFSLRDKTAIKRMAEVGGPVLARSVEELDEHEFAHFDARRGTVVVSRVDTA